MRKKSSLILFSLFIFLSGSFAFGKSVSEAQATLPGNIKTIIKQNCSVSGCHLGKYPAANLNFEADKFLATVLDTPSQEVATLKIIDTSAPEKSYLLAKIKGETGIVGKRMPAGRPPLEETKIQEIEAWVLSLKGNPDKPGDTIKDNYHNGNGEATAAAASQREAFTKPSFWGTRLINLPTTQTPGKGEFLFRISHRFQPPVSSGWDSFYGFDGPAFILFSFGYGITDKLSLTLGRSKLYQEWELSADWLLFEQGKKSPLPLSATLHFGGSLVTQDQPEGARWSGRLRLNTMLSLSYQVTNSVSFLLVPAYSSNTNYWEPDSEGTFGLGIGGRFMFLEDFSFIAEWVPVLAGYKDTTNGWGLGLEKKIGGHVFQFFITNSIGMTASQFLTGGDLKLADGDFRVGFNIFRTF